MNHAVAVAIDTQAVRRRAHQRWLDRGCPAGNPEQDWLEAERELRAESARTTTQVVSSTRAGLDAVTEALQTHGGRRAPRALGTRTGSARLLAALVPEATRELRQAAPPTVADRKERARPPSPSRRSPA